MEMPDGYRKVNSALYDLIPETDIRKQWFLSPDNKSSLIDNEQIEVLPSLNILV